MPINKILLGHRNFKKIFSEDQESFFRLAKEGQNPNVFWIGCSDSRVIPEQIIGSEPGELFVMRNIANIVPPFGMSDDGAGAVIEYAVLHLCVPHIVICGHTECGGIKVLESHVSKVREPHIARWIEMARPAYAQVEALGVPEEARYLETIKRNVLIQLKNLRTYDCVCESEKKGKLTIHGWLYDLHTGDLMAYNDKVDQWETLIISKDD